MRFHHYLLLAVSVMPVCASAAEFKTIDTPITPSDSIYRVQIAAATDQADADLSKQRAEAVGYNPVIIINETPYYRVKAGQFDNYPDADELKDDMRANGFDGAFIVKKKNTEALEALPCPMTGKSNRLGVVALPSLASLSKGNTVESVVSSGLPAPIDLENRLDFAAVANEMEPIIDSSSNSSPKKGYALYYFSLAKERAATKHKANRAMAFDMYKNIALGNIAAPDGYPAKALLLQRIDQ